MYKEAKRTWPDLTIEQFQAAGNEVTKEMGKRGRMSINEMSIAIEEKLECMMPD